MDVFVHSLCTAVGSGINIGGREGTIKIKRYGKWNGKFNSVQAVCLSLFSHPIRLMILIFHQRGARQDENSSSSLFVAGN